MIRRDFGRAVPRRFPMPLAGLLLLSSTLVGAVVWFKQDPAGFPLALVRPAAIPAIDSGLTQEARAPIAEDAAQAPLYPPSPPAPPSQAAPQSPPRPPAALPTVPVVAVTPPSIPAIPAPRVPARIASFIPASLPPTPSPPPWLTHAHPLVSSGGRPQIAVVIDDMGVDQGRSRKVAGFTGPLTLSWLPYAANLPAQTRAARANGHEMLLHMPMEPLGPYGEKEHQILTLRLTPDEVRSRLIRDLNSFEGFVGINNHMGSRFTQDPERMAVVIDELRRRGLLWLDSRTTGNSAGLPLAEGFEVPAIGRDVFLDDENTPTAVARQLAELEALARRRGYAVAIGHPRDATIAALAQWLPAMAGRGFVLVPLTQLVRAKSMRGPLTPIVQGPNHG